MHKTALTSIAPGIYRKRLIVEGFFKREIVHETIEAYFEHITAELGLTPYGAPIIHRTSGQGKDINQGFDGFIPLVDSGIYIAAWMNPRFLSTIVYTCGPFDEDHAVRLVHDFFDLDEHEAAVF